MKLNRRTMLRWLLPLGVCLGLALLLARSVWAYVEAPYALGRLIQESTHIMLVRVEKVDKEKNLIVYSKVQDIKGTHPTDTIKHNIGRGGFSPREWQTIMNWAETGKTGVFFHNGGASETCIQNYWYQAYAGGEWWNMSHAEPYLLRTFAGKPDKLATLVASMLTGQEVLTPCMVDGDKNALQLGQARVQRLRASLKIQDYNPARDFAGWGSEDFRTLAGMPGFTHISGVTRVDPLAGAIAPADFDGDGQVDFCLVGEGKTALIQNGGSSLNETALAGAAGARAAQWSDYNADGQPDLLLASPAGPLLYTNRGGGTFKNDTAGLPREAYYNVTAAAWIDADGDGHRDILFANGFHGLRLYRNLGPKPGAKQPKPALGAWSYCGPFDHAGGKGFDTVYPPEQGIDLKAKYDGKGGEKVGWQAGKFADGSVNSLAVFKPEHNTWCAVYLHRELDFGGAFDLPISLGSDDSLTVWLNGQKLLAENTSRGAAPDQNKLTLKLRPGKNDLLLKICQGDGEFAFYFAASAPAEPVAPLFEDISDRLGLGSSGAGGPPKGDHLAVADVDGDKRADILYSTGKGLLILNTPQGFRPVANSGLNYLPGRVAPVFGDYDGDGDLDLFVPQRAGAKLYRNDGAGKFSDVTSSSGLAGAMKDSTSAAWADFRGSGKLDLIVGCLKGPNRFFRNQGSGKFVDAGDELGLYQRVFNTRGVAAVDLNKDGAVDVIFNNEGQESVVLLGRPGAAKVATAP